MKGFVSFHPVDVAFFDELVAPLTAGRKVNPEAFLQKAATVRRSGWVARRFAVALEGLAAEIEAPKADPSSSVWQRLRTNLEKLDHRPDEAVKRAAKVFDPDLHLDGRPFFVTEGSAERVAEAVAQYAAAPDEAAAEKTAREQLARLDPELAKLVEPADLPDLSSDLGRRNDLLGSLKAIHDLARQARAGGPQAESLGEELPWRAVAMHGQAYPFWLARDVDGLETICRAAGVMAPECLSPAWRLFAEACEAFPSLKDALKLEVSRERDVGAFVSPSEVGQLVDFLSAHGARIIGAAARAGEGPMATGLLRKIKECAVYARKNGLGYLEASGVLPPEREE
jgi:hypothetical protein